MLLQVLSRGRGSAIIENADTNNQNIITKDGYLLFNNWYESIRYTGVIGQYLVKSEGGWKLVDSAEMVLSESFEGVEPFCGRYTVAKKNGSYFILGASQEFLNTQFDCVMWADRGIWGVNIMESGGKRHFFHGQGGDIIYYAHEVLISNKDAILLGKDGLWYYYDGLCEPIPFLRYPIDE